MLTKLHPTRRSSIAFAAAAALWTSVLMAQQTRQNAPAATGTGRIAGVVADASSRPVSRAIVKLTGSEIPAGRAAVTDEKGTFAFDGLPAGRFSLTATKPAYLTATYGAVRFGGAGTPIVLTGNQQISDISLTMPRGGAIAGIVRDANGAPVPAMQVYVVSASAAGSGPRPESVNTDDRGAYRAFGLAPGTYVVYADSRNSGGIGEVGAMSTSEVDATLARLRTRSAGAATPPPATPERTPSSIVRPARTFNSAPIFFPGVTSMAAAAPITLALGEVRDGVDFVYQLARAAAVSGTVTGAGSQNVQLSLQPESAFQNSLSVFGGPILQRRPAGDGEFTFSSVTPGKYTLTARSGPGLAGRGGPAPASGPPLIATTSVEVIGDDIGGLALVLQPTLRVSGRAVFQGAVQPATNAMATVSIRLVPAGATPNSAGSVPLSARAEEMLVAMPVVSMPLSGAIRPDGTFQIDGVMPGTYRLAVPRDPAGWRSKAAMLGGKDVLDVSFQVGSGDVTDIELSFSDQHSQIAGRLQKADGSPAAGYFVVAFSADDTLWTPQSRRLRSVRPGTDGEFRLDDLPAGDYYLAALTDADSNDWQSPSFLAQVVPAAIKLTLADGERKTQNLRIGR